MAGIGFELRKLFREQGLINNVKAYAFSALTTIGPMILSIVLIIALQRMMDYNNASFLDWELYIATVQYCFIFSIIITSGISLLLTRFIADMIFQKKYNHLLSSYYGALIISLPAGAIVAYFFLQTVSASFGYKLVAYLFFMELIVVWIQAVYLSALKDYMRIVRSFALGVVVSLASGWVLLSYTDLNATTAALSAIDIGFLLIATMSSRHFEQIFPSSQFRLFFVFITYLKKYPSLFVIGTFFYSGIYIHSFVYWFSSEGNVVQEGFRVSTFYDLPVFYAFLSVVPTLVTFVVSVETSFYEKFRIYYKQVIEGGTYQDMKRAKVEMQRTLMQEISFLMEVQLFFTIMSIAVGMKFLPQIGFSIAQVDAFNLLVLGYFLFIIMFVFLHILMYFDDRKGVLMISSLFVFLNAVLTYVCIQLDSDGLGMLLASLISLLAAIARILFVLRNIDYYTFCTQPIHRRSKSSKLARLTGKPGAIVGIIVLSASILSGCTSAVNDSAASTEQKVEASTSADQGTKLAEDKRLYERDADDSIKTLYITVLPDKSKKPTKLDWYGLNRLTDRYSEESMKIIMQEGNANGSGPATGMFGYGQDKANASISLRGNTARYASQKSYKIRLTDEAGLWQDQRTLNLNKHSYDLTRVLNKLSFDLMEKIPDFTSLRTQFVHLYVKDLSGGGSAFEDYGLYTQIEQPNEMFLKSHWLDPYGQLYKIAFFEFFRYPEFLKSKDDPTYDKKAFESHLEIKGREDHEKLLAMLDDVNDMSMPIDEVIEKHFDLDNYLTWLAVNILTDNMDTDANNFYLYSPLNSDKWYFLPWDYDGGWGVQRNLKSISEYQAGLSNYWGSVLHNRYFRSAEHIQQLTDKINEVHKYINKDTITKQLELYRGGVSPFLNRAPDQNYLPGTKAELSKEMLDLANVPERGIKLYQEDLEKPKPFYLDDVVKDGDQQQLTWGLSYDFQGDDLTYDVTVALDPAFQQIVKEQKGLVTTTTLVALTPNVYYWKVIARDSKGHTQIAFDRYDGDDQTYYGIRQFEVK
ncbi:exopolysaccharide Pel transporter PelG [Paenibacillus sacheonensis]|uniref:Exopolysaccharide Pel transporter PelG n=1 Tax=Paenibacillus sacheonensis TaxID=742054 RepID=A0A7X4YT13_9BACL|nr:exopolysaccharide Pel transporter PelG [Paenibacillus sacheonensis]MBM7567704.1 putative membrane protein [Paenibacillus sacheonensis]NBC72020.1 exopolysaccharide Pel transporter PelG [Paenibacillus sacheonensis]